MSRSSLLLAFFWATGCFQDASDTSGGTGSDSATGGSAGSTSAGSTSAGSGTAGSGTAGSGTAGSGTAGSGGSSGGTPSGCDQLCSLLSDHCIADNAQYSGEDVCLAVCSFLPPGMMGDQTGNTVECRRSQAIQAAETPETFCDTAGPTGDGVCGGACESFCFLADQICTGNNAQWPSIPDCIQSCMNYATDPAYDPAIKSGNTYGCRLYHLTVAALDAGTHCPHIGDTSPPTACG